jgi:hypothetical protein
VGGGGGREVGWKFPVIGFFVDVVGLEFDILPSFDSCGGESNGFHGMRISGFFYILHDFCFGIFQFTLGASMNHRGSDRHQGSAGTILDVFCDEVPFQETYFPNLDLATSH